MWLFVPLAASGTRQGLTCRVLAPLPSSLQQNTVASGTLVKTVAMEKEVFNCTPTAGGAPTIRDQETFIDLIERTSTTGIGPVGSPQVESATCDKSLSNGLVRCSSVPVSLGTVSAPIAGCTQGPQPPGPQMNTVTIGKFVKTVKVEKELFTCGSSIADVYVFTEVIEQQTSTPAGPTYSPLATRFVGVVCYKSASAGTITSCAQFNTAG
jgi:hypothetical protein